MNTSVVKPFTGEIRMFGGAQCPDGWMMCDGAPLHPTQYPDLFGVIGITFGGDGVNTFNLPDLRGRIPIGMGQGPNLSNREVGEAGGEEAHVLTMSEMPAHSHSVMVANVPATSQVPGQSMVYAQASGTVSTGVYGLYADVMSTTSLDPAAVSTFGQSQPHDNMMCTRAVFFMIATSGTYPT